MTKARKINVVVWFTIAIMVIAGVLTEWSKQSADGLEWSQVIACTVAYTLFSVALWACIDEIIKDFQK